MSEPRVAVLMGSESDAPKLEPAYEVFEKFGVAFEKRIASAHRSPGFVADYVRDAESRGVRVFLCAAGLAAHLAGTVAAHTHLPVIGIPIATGALSGLDALLATVQMPPGVPVATVTIDGAKNAAILALQILAVSDDALAAKLREMKREMADGILAANSP